MLENKLHKKKGFTLAEVLITIAIVGVVAAMTLPNLIQNYQKKVISTKLKKFQAMMSQAILMAEQDFGPMEDWPSEYKDDTVVAGNRILKT